MLPLVLPQADLEVLHADASAGQELTIDLERKVVVRPDGKGEIPFDLDDFKRHCLINGLDDIGREYTSYALVNKKCPLMIPILHSHPATPRRDRDLRVETYFRMAMARRARLRQEGWKGTSKTG